MEGFNYPNVFPLAGWLWSFGWLQKWNFGIASKKVKKLRVPEASNTSKRSPIISTISSLKQKKEIMNSAIDSHSCNRSWIEKRNRQMLVNLNVIQTLSKMSNSLQCVNKHTHGLVATTQLQHRQPNAMRFKQLVNQILKLSLCLSTSIRCNTVSVCS